MKVTIEVDETGGQWEATMTGIGIPEYGYSYESTDPVTLLAAIGRDLDRLTRDKKEPHNA